ncbi:MAG: type VI secretion system tip protein VgrG [Massilia sp.]|nr:type VI secretion system tip protein VgrG [Massilia sp.]
MNLSEAAADIAALSGFGKASQNNRLLRLDFPFGDGPKNGVLLVNTLHAREELSRDFRIELELLSDDAFIALKSMMAKMVTVSLVRADGSLRYFNGYVTEFRLIKTDGGFAFYQMVLGPWLSFARLREDCVSFLNKNVIELTEATFEHYLERDFRTRLDDADPKLVCANQYNETDYNHLHRRWEDLGLHYWYEHRADGHTLWLADNTAFAPWIDTGETGGVGEIVFRSDGGAEESDGIRAWQATRQLGSGALTLTSFNYKQPRPQRALGYSANRQGDVFAFERFRNAGAFGYRDRADGEALAARGIEELDSMTQYFHAQGNDRHAQAGRSFRLLGHFSGEPPRSAVAERDYVILAIDHHASNNYQANCQTGPGALSNYTNEMTCVRQSVRWRPGRGYNSAPRTDPGVQTAIVVGPAGHDIHTDGLGRVKLQFHWDRAGNNDEHSSPWVRVTMPIAGGQFGQIGLPRVGQEVVVQFLDGNVDHPIITGLVYNGDHLPPWQLPDQCALSGLRSRELGAGGRGNLGNHLVLDDTAGALQAQLKSDHAHSQLSLGRITRIEDNAGRKDARGEGWELATEAWGVARAGRGMLLTTEPRPRAQGEVKAIDESVKRLAAAAALQRSLADAAHAHDVANAAGDQSAVADVVKGQIDAIKGAGSGDGTFPELSAPHLVLASAAGIETSSKKSTHIASAEHIALTTGRNFSIATGDSLLASVANAFRLFVHKAGMRLIAASGKVHIQAQSDDITAIANKVLSLISESDWVDIRGKKGVRLHGADSMLEISDKVQFFTASPTIFHGNIETLAPKNRQQVDAAAPKFNAVPNDAIAPEPDYLYHDLRAHSAGGQYENVAYALYKGDTKVEDGMTDRFGRAKIAHQPGTKSYRIALGNGETFSLDVSPTGKDQSPTVKSTAPTPETRLADDTPSSRQHD